MKNKTHKLILTVLTMSTVLAFAACGNTDTAMESEPLETVETAESTETSTLEKESGDGKTESAAKADGTEVLPVTEVSASVTEKTEAESTVDIRQTVSQENFGTGENDKTGGTSGYTYTEMNETMYAKNAVNVRNLPSTNGTKLGRLKKNNEVAVTGRCNETGWYRISYGDGEAFVSDKYLSNEKNSGTAGATNTTSVAKNIGSASTDFLTPEGFLNTNNPIVAAAYAEYGENIAICEDGTVLDASTWQILGHIDGVHSASENSSFLTDGYDRAAAEEVWKCMNEERVAEGRNPLAWDEDIYNFACQRASLLVTDYSHNGCGSYGENIYNSTGLPSSGELIHLSWYLSPGHHANYLDSRYGSGACAVYVYNGSVYAVENFALASVPNEQITGEPENTESELIGEIDNGTYWTASNGVTLFIRSDGLTSVTMSNEHTPEECKAALDEYNASH